MPFMRNKTIPVQDEDGNQTGSYITMRDTAPRWRALFIWCLLFTLITFATVWQVSNLARNNESELQDNEQVLVELCRTNAIIRGLAQEDKELYANVIISTARAPIEDKILARIAEHAGIVQGYIDQLDQQTACVEITNP